MPLFILAIAIPDLFYFMTFNKKKMYFYHSALYIQGKFFFFIIGQNNARNVKKNIRNEVIYETYI